MKCPIAKNVLAALAALMLLPAAAPHAELAPMHAVASISLPYSAVKLDDVSADGRFLVVTAPGGLVKIVDTHGGSARILDATSHIAYGGQVRFSPDGRLLLAVGRGIAAWEPDTGRLAWTAESSTEFSSFAISRDSQTVYLARDNVSLEAGHDITLEAISLQTHTVLWQAHPGRETLSMAVSNDGAVLAAGSDADEIRLYDARSGADLGTLADRESPGHPTVVSQDDNRADPGYVIGLAFAGPTLVSADSDGVINSWDIAARRRTATVACTGGAGPLSALADGTLFAGCGLEIRVVWPHDSGTTVLRDEGGVASLAATADGRTLWSLSDDGTLEHWLLPGRTPVETFGRAVAGAFSRDGRRYAIAWGDDTIALNNFSGGHIHLRGFDPPAVGGQYSRPWRAMTFDAAGSRLLVGAYVTDGFVDHSGVAGAKLYLYDALHDGSSPSRAWNDVAMERGAISSDGRRLLVRSPSLIDTPDTVWRVAAHGDVLSRWIPVDHFCDGSGAFAFAVPLSVRGRDGIVFPGIACNTSRPDSMHAVDLVRHRSLVTYQASAGLTPVAFDADATSVGMIATNGTLSFWDTETGVPRAHTRLVVPPAGSERIASLFVRGAYAAVIVSTSPSSPRSPPAYEVTLYRTRDARAVARASGSGSLLSADVLSRGQVGVITDQSVDLWRP